ncbi:hypothetical protein AB0L40_11330 [Patulibacter sp. NPDC049589]|uniref:hypothetical protein n=1 Tax=Patulibacter sp. NPDC049589 TaxID=3154731 RepID=UPI00343ED9BD
MPALTAITLEAPDPAAADAVHAAAFDLGDGVATRPAEAPSAGSRRPPRTSASTPGAAGRPGS